MPILKKIFGIKGNETRILSECPTLTKNGYNELQKDRVELLSKLKSAIWGDDNAGVKRKV